MPVLLYALVLLSVMPGIPNAGVGAVLLPTLVQGTAEAREVKMLPPNMLSTFQKKDQRAEMFQRANAALNDVLTKEDAPKAVRYTSKFTASIQ